MAQEHLKFSTGVGIGATLTIHVRWDQDTCEIEYMSHELDKSGIMTVLLYDVKVDYLIDLTQTLPCPDQTCKKVLTVKFNIKQYFMVLWFLPFKLKTSPFQYEVTTPCLTECCPPEDLPSHAAIHVEKPLGSVGIVEEE